MSRIRSEQQTEAGSSPAADEALWKAYWTEGSPRARNALILRYLPLVRLVVGRLPYPVRAHWEQDDLVSIGVVGLIATLAHWELNSPVGRFEGYASARVRGAILDELRRLDWLPRTVRHQVIAYRSAEEELTGSLGRTPESSEILSSMSVDTKFAQAVLRRVVGAQLLRLDHRVTSKSGDDGAEVADFLACDESLAPDARLLANERLDEVQRGITALPLRQRQIVALHLLEGRTQEDIGRLLGVSNSRVCQIEATALRTLRRMLLEVDETVRVS